MRALGWEGRFVTLGFAGGAVPAVRANHLLVKNAAVLGLQWTDYRQRQPAAMRAAQAQIFAFWRQGLLAPRIAGRYPLEGIVAALERIEAGRPLGRLLLSPGLSRAE